MAFRAPRAVPSLDGIRLVGLCFVVFAHLPMVAESETYNALWRLNQATKVGYLLLDLFFTLSGFLITRLLLAEKVAFGRISFTRFYARRALRILPIYYLTLVACIVVFHFRPGEIAALATYTFNIYHPLVPLPNAMEHTWSLSVEEQFYLFWPMLIALTPIRLGAVVTGRIIPAMAFLSAVVVTVMVPLSENELAGNLIYMLPVTRMVSLSLGAWIAFRELAGKPIPDRWLLAMFIAAICFVVGDKISRDNHLIVSQGAYWTLSLTGFGLMSMSVLGALVFSANRVVLLGGKILSLPFMRAGGRATYGGYLYHLPILYYFGLNDAVVNGAKMPISRVAMALGVTIAVAAFSYRFIEGPLLSRKNRIGRVAPGPARHPSPASAPAATGAPGLGIVGE
jgi:peptidoglycan/LPS O-acetylase OafA/YrhL